MEGGVEIGYTITFLKSQPITIYNGQKGQDGDSFFSSVDTSNPEYVIFTLTDGTQFTVPRYTGIKLTFNTTDIKLGHGNNMDINITAEGSTDFTPDNFFVVTPDGWKNSITKTADPGKEFTLNLTSPADKDSEGEVLVMLDNKQGNTTIGRIKVDSKSTYLLLQNAAAGTLYNKINNRTDLESIVASGSFNKTDWDAIAANRNTLLHLDLENCTYEEGNGEDLIYFTIGSQNIPLKTLRLPQNITKIGETAFALCGDLTEVKLPDGLKEIQDNVFYDCSSLNDITIPKGVESLGNQAFYQCTSLTNITIHDGLKSIGNEAFYDCSALIEIKLPDGLTSIGKEAFYSCSALTSIKLPDDGLTSIGEKAFYNCSTLTSIKLPEGLKIIEKETFYGCTSLTDITIPESIEFIYDSFTGTALNTVTCLAETPPEVYFIAFMYANVIYVPAGSVEDYKKALNWSLYADKITTMP